MYMTQHEMTQMSQHDTTEKTTVWKKQELHRSSP